MAKEKEEKKSITLNEGRCVFVYSSEKETDFLENSNIPHLSVEDHKHWKGYSTKKENPNLIGQIHQTNRGVIFNLCDSPKGKTLNKADLKAIIKGIDYIEEFIRKKIKSRGKK